MAKTPERPNISKKESDQDRHSGSPDSKFKKIVKRRRNSLSDSERDDSNRAEPDADNSVLTPPRGMDS